MSVRAKSAQFFSSRHTPWLHLVSCLAAAMGRCQTLDIVPLQLLLALHMLLEKPATALKIAQHCSCDDLASHLSKAQGEMHRLSPQRPR